jgi:hypothetical protein
VAIREMQPTHNVSARRRFNGRLIENPRDRDAASVTR